MKIGMPGTGAVSRALGTGFTTLRHEVAAGVENLAGKILIDDHAFELLRK